MCVVHTSFPQRGRRQGWEESGQRERCGMKQEQGHADSRTWSLNSLILTNIFMKFIFSSAPSVVSVAFLCSLRLVHLLLLPYTKNFTRTVHF